MFYTHVCKLKDSLYPNTSVIEYAVVLYSTSNNQVCAVQGNLSNLRTATFHVLTVTVKAVGINPSINVEQQFKFIKTLRCK